MLRLKLSETDVPSRISTIFYFGLEGLGGVDLDTEENENVCKNRFLTQQPRTHPLYRALMGQFRTQAPLQNLTNSQYGSWMVRVYCPHWTKNDPLTSIIGPANNMDIPGNHASRFLDRIGKTHVAGFRVPAGNIWQAKGSKSLSPKKIVSLQCRKQMSYCKIS